MIAETRIIIIDAIKRIIESSWRGREHTAEEIVYDIKDFLNEENEYSITEEEWHEILDQYPISDLSDKIFQIKDTFVNKYGYGERKEIKEVVKEGVPEEEKKEAEEIRVSAEDPIIQEQELSKQLREIRKQGINKIVSLFQETFTKESGQLTDIQLISFINANSLGEKENKRTVIIALQSIVGLERILRVFDIIEEKKPFDSKMELFESWLKKQKNV
ncbi:hypothetical protein KAU34_02895 [candidate division WOR-3 bacterium]|jgi:hypothetical protein|nr:hypothetical protein [candidate division WOR-3 bacterium]